EGLDEAALASLEDGDRHGLAEVTRCLLRELSARLPEPWRAARCQRHLVEGRPCEIGPAHGLLPHEAQPTACREETVGGRVRDCELVRDLAHRELAALAHELDDEECVLCRTHRGLLSVAGGSHIEARKPVPVYRFHGAEWSSSF